MPIHVLERQVAATAHGEFALDVLTGLSERPKRLSSKWFYDDEGSRLFQKIMATEAYYPTDSERWIFEQRGAEIARHFAGRDIDVVDLGAGDGAKTIVLLEHLRAAGVTVRYVPIDISEGAMRELVPRIEARFPGMDVTGVVGGYVSSLRWLSQQDDRTRLVLFLGSNIGNFDKPRARAFLRRLWTGLQTGDHALIGFDLKKDIEVLLDAYNDPDGVTRAFNLNLLTRINRELGANFDLQKWRHYGTYNVFSGAMESYLVSLEQQEVHITALRHSFRFASWEPIHTEYSYKYLPEDVESLAESTRFEVLERYLDDRGWFCDALWRVR
jgi:dimethylhistidine N-methyltransferase